MKVSFMKKEISHLQGNMSVPYAPSKRPNSAGRRVFTWIFVLLPVLLFLISLIIDYWRIRTDAVIVLNRYAVYAESDGVADSIYCEDSTVVFEDSLLVRLQRGRETAVREIGVSPAVLREQVQLKKLLKSRIILARKEIRDAEEYLKAVERLFRAKAATFGELSEARKRVFWAKDHLESLNIEESQYRLNSSGNVSVKTGYGNTEDTVRAEQTLFIDSLFVKKGSVVLRGEKICSVRPEPAEWYVDVICRPNHLPYLYAGKKGVLLLPDRSKVGIEITSAPPTADVDTTGAGLISGPREIVHFKAKITEQLPDWVMVNGLNVHVQFLKR